MELIDEPWSKSNKEILEALEVNKNNGLSFEEAKRRTEQFGKNLLVEEKRVSFVKVFKHEVVEPMILLLLVVGVIYTIFGIIRDNTIFDGITIFAIIATLVFVEIYNEFRAKKTIASLKQLAAPTTTVLREAQIEEIKPELLVPGDILMLKIGQKVPTDARLLESFGLQLNESALTGESIPIGKNSGSVLEKDTDLMEKTNMVFAGTTVTRGKGKAVVTSISMDTELGKIAGLTKALKDPKTTLQRAMKQLSQYLVFVALTFCILIPIIGIFQGQDLIEMILTGLSLSFATIPEELPIVIMVVLALGAYVLTRQKILVINLRTAETLGSVTTIATDKTGTLTENKMEVSQIYMDTTLQNFEKISPTKNLEFLLNIGVLLNDVLIKSQSKDTPYIGDPMEIALIKAAKKKNIDYDTIHSQYQLIDECSFDNHRMLMSQIYSKETKFYLYVKGATESLLNRTSKILINQTEQDITQGLKEDILKITNEMANEGLRVIAFAYKELQGLKQCDPELEIGLKFIGLVGFVDPPRLEVRDAILRTNQAGIKIKMITGDYAITAKSIAKKVGIENDHIITGKEVEALSDENLQEKMNEVSIVARATPEHKLRIVKALKENGERVAVTGDGINDAPALRVADIGVAMGMSGTDVAREASDMILLDDNFSSISIAIEQGRKLYENLKKGVKYYLAVKLALIIIFLLPVLVNIELPFTPIQIILLELFMDLAASVTFVVEPSESDVMKIPPRDPKEKFISFNVIVKIIVGGVCLIVGVLVVYFVSLSQGVRGARTMAFTSWMIGHIFLALNMRTISDPLYKIGFFSNKMMVIWGVSVVATLFVIMYIPPLQSVFNISPLGLIEWLFILLVAFISTFWLELYKIIKDLTTKK